MTESHDKNKFVHMMDMGIWGTLRVTDVPFPQKIEF